MNRSYSKIRHIQESNLRLENKFMESKLGNVKPLNEGWGMDFLDDIRNEIKYNVIILKPKDDPYSYMKSGDTYYYIMVGKTGKKPHPKDSGWKKVEDSKTKAFEAIKKLFDEAEKEFEKEDEVDIPEPTKPGPPSAKKVMTAAHNAIIDTLSF